MRPLRLEIKGFTAFRDPQTIDFAGLDLFAISGQTGSGKTSILDAITYALYGTIERVGKQAGQFVSQGQVRMAVCLEFAVAGERFRVTRSTPARGASKILLERWDGQWRQAGEGADRVREADAMIKGAIGLDYDAFTRTVLLPQGRFAEFLVGDAKERRKILTELLGLELFERLGKRAGEMRRDAEAEARASTTLLETEYAGVTPDAVAQAEARAKEAGARFDALGAAESKVRAVAERWAEIARAIGDLEASGRDLRTAASTASRAADELDDLAERSAGAASLVKERDRAVAQADRAVAKATKARTKAEEGWGRAVDLARLHAKAGSLVNARDVRREAEETLASAQAALPVIEREAADAAEAFRVATADAEAAIAAMSEAEAGLEEARHADLVAAVRAGVRRGEDCPVCGAKVTTMPRQTRARPLAQAEAALEKARKVAGEAQAALQRSSRASDASTAKVQAAANEVARCRRLVAKAAADVGALEVEVAAAMGGRLPADPLGTIEERLERLEALEEEDRAAREALAEAREALTDSERDRDGLASSVAESRVRLESIPARGLLERARSLGASPAPPLPALASAKDPAALAGAARAIAERLDAVSEEIVDLATRHGTGEAESIREAAGHVEGLVNVRVGSLAELVEAVLAARVVAAKGVATAEERAELLRTKLANAAAIVEQVAGHRERADRFEALAKELRADRLTAFLQVEALQVLAAAGSDRLSTLSSGRYQLAFEEDEFFVVDTWNGEERRTAKTLSGGETFLASLALALALSEQVRSLAVTEKAHLDSLFLDEGFGTLDPESLEVVVDAIEQLGGDGRMVGVITHVQELAIRLPARIEVEKSPRGSRLRMAS